MNTIFSHPSKPLCVHTLGKPYLFSAKLHDKVLCLLMKALSRCHVNTGTFTVKKKSGGDGENLLLPLGYVNFVLCNCICIGSPISVNEDLKVWGKVEQCFGTIRTFKLKMNSLLLLLLLLLLSKSRNKGEAGFHRTGWDLCVLLTQCP